MWSWWPRKREEKARARIAADDEKLGEIPRSPPFAKGLPAASVDRLLRDQTDILRLLRSDIALGNGEYERLIMPVIRKYTEFVHLLPASENNHHREAGGLLRHGFEVAHYAARRANGEVWDVGMYPERRQARGVAWVILAGVAGLLHDIGKVSSDIAVTTESGHCEWNPNKQSLLAWARDIQTERYFLRWKPFRKGRHKSMWSDPTHKIIEGDFDTWLGEQPEDLRAAFFDAVSGAVEGKLLDVVVAADMASTSADMKRRGAMIDPGIGVPVERYLIQAVRALITEGAQRWNVRGSALWHLRVDKADAAYLVWPAMAFQMIAKTREDNVPGIPQNPDVLLSILLERGIIVPSPDSEVLIQLLVDDMKKPLTFVKLADVSILNSHPPSVIEAKSPGSGQTNQQQPAPASPSTPKGAPAKPAPKVAPQKPAPKVLLPNNVVPLRPGQPIKTPVPVKEGSSPKAAAAPPSQTEPSVSQSSEVENAAPPAACGTVAAAEPTEDSAAAEKVYLCPGCNKVLEDVESGRCGKCGRAFDPALVKEEEQPQSAVGSDAAEQAVTPEAMPAEGGDGGGSEALASDVPGSEEQVCQEDIDDLIMADPVMTMPLWRAIKDPQIDANEFVKVTESGCFLRYPHFLKAAWPEGKDYEKGRQIMIEANLISAREPDDQGWIPLRRGPAEVLVPLITFVGLGPTDRSKPNRVEEDILKLFAERGARVLTLSAAEFNQYAKNMGLTPGAYTEAMMNSEFFVRRTLPKDGHQLELIRNHEG
ncbi:MAG: hypothetical protein F8N36_14200 [Desulfovibrio sp.]|uniref:MobH family relaxase n=1 Tax=Desulfovibrio sp. TaxID=885 RepID=UPI00135D2637|nr:MobH family relaxase [Desulfovibrio sp.]MTJ93990.1 hypothetical protein [Desulfovibrio sp.]